MIDIRPVEVDGKHFVETTINGEVKRYGPYANVDAAVALANQFNAICRTFYWGDAQATPMPVLRKVMGGSRRG